MDIHIYAHRWAQGPRDAPIENSRLSRVSVQKGLGEESGWVRLLQKRISYGNKSISHDLFGPRVDSFCAVQGYDIPRLSKTLTPLGPP